MFFCSVRRESVASECISQPSVILMRISRSLFSFNEWRKKWTQRADRWRFNEPPRKRSNQQCNNKRACRETDRDRRWSERSLKKKVKSRETCVECLLNSVNNDYSWWCRSANWRFPPRSIALLLSLALFYFFSKFELDYFKHFLKYYSFAVCMRASSPLILADSNTKQKESASRCRFVQDQGFSLSCLIIKFPLISGLTQVSQYI